ncbi:MULTISPECIES: PIG-L deacetylase family protein [unclassified Sporosarcina]|uniref:PIG-L deacetylase family protein n=1 Tax=unclassified Sporosarcina TaxID=2647733 RepID=UPI00203D1E0C|nr:MULTISPECIES: PIG-L family deacetylase [unclassified Sporosarcina]GKV64852.1 PIG-L domain-containing protein [Sporosarcina sp. NCCP-2331]GLB54962.1 PIG-L domain-containing protein [Sporosarcina sp. NCCP-2378]
MKTILVIAAHPDDEVLGCGGTMAKHSLEGDRVYTAILAEGLTSRNKKRDREHYSNEFSILHKAAQKANDILGVLKLELLDFPDNRMDSVDRLDIIKVIEELINKVKPDIIYTHHIGDVNIDHRRIHEAVMTAVRPIPGNHCVEELLFFETASSTEWITAGTAPAFTPNWYVNIEKTLSLKLKALEAYETEMRNWPHARSIIALDHLAKWRGANIGVEAAEAFMLGRKITR